MTDPVEVLRRFHEAINALDFASIEASFAEDAVYSSGAIVSELYGKADIMAAFRKYFAEYPDQVAQDHSIERLSKISARSQWSLRATNVKTGDRLIRQGTETIFLNADGKIARVDVADSR